MFATTGLIATYLGFAGFHLIAAWYFRRWLRARLSEASSVPPGPQAPAAILVAARGFDPSLEQMLHGLLDQDYSDFEIQMVVDSPHPHSLEQIRGLVGHHPQVNRLHLHRLIQPLTTCGLKNSALLLAWEHLSPTVEVVAMIDTDTVPPTDWLSRLTRPLADPAVGAVTGAQWFEPAGQFEPGTLVRCLWNAAAIVPTCLFANAWAGSLAFRRESFERAGLPKIWSKTIVDDGPLPAAMARIQLRMHFAPDLIMVNRESCSVSFVTNYLARMLRWSRLYESSFRNTLGHAAITLGIWLGLLAVSIQEFLAGRWGNLGLVAVGLGVGSLMYVGAWSLVRRAVAESSDWARQRTRDRLPTRVGLKLGWLVPLTQWTFCLATIRALLATRIRWRGAEYRITGPDQVELLMRSDPPATAGPSESSI